MNGAWATSYFILWVVVIIQLIALVAISREIGGRLAVLTDRLSRQRIEGGPELNQLVPPLVLGGNDIKDIVRSTKKGALIVFVTPTCGACKKLISSFGRLSWDNKVTDVIVISRSDQSLQGYDSYKLPLTEAGVSYYSVAESQVEPFGINAVPLYIWVDSDCLVRSKGIASISILETVVRTMPTQVPTTA